MDLYQHLQDYVKQNKLPMHMPGHKRNASFFMDNPYSWDVTEVEGTDNLHHPEGILKWESERLRKRYKTLDSYFLVNGSTCGILASIAACCRRGDKILVARNCHRSVYHAMFLFGLEPVYLYPNIDEKTGILLDISPEQVEEQLELEKVSCVVITSPTYEGIVSDIEAIANACHKRDIPLIVDEAHGAHFAWSNQFPQTAMEQGADLVIESLHKTLPSLTQTALLHRATERISGKMLMQYLAMFETSSPSYILMGSISQCVSWLEEQGDRVWEEYEKNLSKFEIQALSWHHLQLWRHDKRERSKLVIGTWGTNITGGQLAERLRIEYDIEVEMETSHYILAMTSVADTKQSMKALAEALSEIDLTLTGGTDFLQENIYTVPKALVRKNAYDASYCAQQSVQIHDALGQISAEYAFLYPPGIPFLAPGEEITTDIIEQFNCAKKYELTLLGLEDEKALNIRVCI